MPSPFSSGTNALGICDICGLTEKLRSLRYTYQKGVRTGFRACPKCYDPDHPQNFVPDAVRAHGPDAEAVRDPRPQTNWSRQTTGLDEYERRVNSPND